MQFPQQPEEGTRFPTPRTGVREGSELPVKFPAQIPNSCSYVLPNMASPSTSFILLPSPNVSGCQRLEPCFLSCQLTVSSCLDISGFPGCPEARCSYAFLAISSSLSGCPSLHLLFSTCRFLLFLLDYITHSGNKYSSLVRNCPNP